MQRGFECEIGELRLKLTDEESDRVRRILAKKRLEYIFYKTIRSVGLLGLIIIRLNYQSRNGENDTIGLKTVV